MPTPLEKYLSETQGLSQLPNEFAIGTDNAGADNLLSGIKSFGKAIPHTLSQYLSLTRKKWTGQTNAAWVQMMVENPNMNVVHIYHERGSECISDAWGFFIRATDGGLENKINSEAFIAKFEKKYEGDKYKNSTYREIVAVIDGGFVNIATIEIEKGYAKLKR